MPSETFILPLSNPPPLPDRLKLPSPMITGAFGEEETRQPRNNNNTHTDNAGNCFDAYPSPDGQVRHQKKKKNKRPWFNFFGFPFHCPLTVDAVDAPEDTVHPIPPSCDDYPYHRQYHSLYYNPQNLQHSEAAPQNSSDPSHRPVKIANPWILSLTIPVILLVMVRGPWLLDGALGVLFLALFLGLMYNILFGVCLTDARRFAAMRECFRYACEPGSTFRFMDVVQMAVFFAFGLYVLAALNSGGWAYVHY